MRSEKVKEINVCSNLNSHENLVEQNPKGEKEVKDNHIPIILDVNDEPLLKASLLTILKQGHNCKACGGILPEIWFDIGDLRFQLTCYEIWDTRTFEIKKKTNYTQLGEYCKVQPQ